MACSNCNGKHDLFLGQTIHERGCPSKGGSKESFDQGQSDERQLARQRSNDASYRLGRAKEERKRLDNAFPVVGGRRRRGPLL
jgi:hypothetical protein